MSTSLPRLLRRHFCGGVRESERAGGKQLWNFVHATANVPEYHDPAARGRKSADIALDDVLTSVGRDAHAVEAVLADAAALCRHRAALGS